MSLEITTVLDVVDAAPGTIATTTARVHNRSDVPTVATITVVGFGPGVAAVPDGVAGVTVEVAAGDTVDVRVPIPIPIDLAVGHHAAALQVVATGRDARPVLAPFTIAVESVQKVGLSVEPTPVRGRRRASFVVGISNDESTPVSFTLGAEAEQVRVRFKTSAFRLLPGERTSTKARVRGPRHIVGEPIQHNLVIAAQGKASATTTTAPFIQRPAFAAKARGLVAALAVIALWLAAIGGVALWVANRTDDGVADPPASAEEAALVRLVDANGEVLANGPYTVRADGTIIDADGEVVAGFVVDENGNLVDANGNPVNGVVIDESNVLVDVDGTPIGLPPSGTDDGTGGGSGDGGPGGETADGGSGSGGDGTASGSDGTPVTGIIAPTSTVLRGSVVAVGNDDLSDVAITLATLDLGAVPSPGSTVIDPPGSAPGAGTPDQTSATKMWSARFAPLANQLGALRQTAPIPPRDLTAEVDGVWLIPDVALRRTYELRFAKPGFDTQSFVVAPPDDGTPIELDVVLEPASGAIAGSVVDASGRPLGGVELALSDGTLVFTTTSATDGDVGTYSFDGVSTPGVYTLTATRSGYGTEVLQLPMTAGQERTDADVTMFAGVGAISGTIVGEDGSRLGGVTVTATNGEVTRTTTSLTEGNTGFFSIPQLDVPSTYTVSVEFPGYVPQTRRVAMSGSVSGINFALITTTQRLTGVISSEGGGGIVGAAITMTSGDLEFEVSSAASPRAGAYFADDLPPGNYTVSVAHFEHDTVTEFIELVAGVAPAPLDITLPIRTNEFDPGTGSLVVEVIDPAAEDADRREVKNATVQLVRTLTGETERTVTQEAFDFRITDIPLGTYTILVSAAGYNDAAPRLVSIGRSEERRTVEMQQLGQASGQVIDSITKQPLGDYAISLYRQRPEGDEIFVTRVVVPQDSIDGVWATEPNTLTTGIYRAELEGRDSPPGYIVRNDQDLDEDVDDPMLFEIPPDIVDVVEVPIIEADPYPNILGRVYKPRLDGTTTRFLPIDDATLSVGMRCGGTLVDIPVTDEFGATGSDQFDSFFLNRRVVDAEQLVGECELEFSADDYVTKVVPLPDVVPSNGVVLSDRVVNAALAAPVENLGGTVFWIDDRDAGERLPLLGVDISASPITRFDATDTPLPAPGPEPTDRSETISTQSVAGTAANGDPVARWDLNGQIFGEARYTFTEEGFGPGLIDVRIDETATRTVTDVSGVVLTELPNGDFDVELEPPNDSSISGVVTIVTNDNSRTPLYDQVDITATGPFDETFSIRCDDNSNPPAGRCVDRTAGSFNISPAAAGTWTTSFLPPPNHVLLKDAAGNDFPSSVSERVFPGSPPVTSFNTTFVERGEIEVTVVNDKTGAPIDAVTLEVTGSATVPEVTFGPGNGNVFTLLDIPVHPSDPLNPAVAFDYVLNVKLDGFDPAGAVITNLDTNAQIFAPSNAIPLNNLLAGDKPRLEVRMAPYGGIRTQAFGFTSAPADAAAWDILLPGGADDLDITVNRVDRFGNLLDADPPFSALSVDALPLGNPDGTDDSFEIIAAPGYYTVTVSHPQFDQKSPPVLPSESCTTPPDPVGCPDNSLVAGVYRIVNKDTRVLNGQFELQIKRSAIDFEVVDSFAGDNPISQADIRVKLEGSAEPESQAYTGANGLATVGNLIPGTYDVTINHYTTPTDPSSGADAFPVIVKLVVKRSGAQPFVLDVKAPLPQVNATISGDVVALNSNDQPVPLPAVTVTQNFSEPSIEISEGAGPVTTVLNTEGPNPSTTVGDGTTGSETYTFSNVPYGDHVLTFTEPTALGYSVRDRGTPDALRVDVPDVGVGVTQATTVTYEVENLQTVTATITGATNQESFPDLVVTLTSPDNAVVRTVSFANMAPPKTPVTVTFNDVPPYLADYTLTTSDALHAGFSTTVTVPVLPDETVPYSLNTNGVQFTPTANAARVTGLVSQNSGQNTTALPANGSVELAGPGTITPATPLTGPDLSEYSFDADTAGQYTLSVKNLIDGYKTETRLPQLFLGVITTVDPIEITRAATFRITIPNKAMEPNLTVEIVDRQTNVAVAAVPPNPTQSWDFEANVTANNPYFVRLSGPGIPNSPITPILAITGTTDVTPSSGATINETFTLPRRVRVNVTNEGNDTDVRVYTSAPTNDLSNPAPVAQILGKSDPFTFTNTGANAIPASGKLWVLIDRADHRSIVREVETSAGLDVTLSEALQDDLDVRGTIFRPDGITDVGNNVDVRATATVNGATVTRTVSTNGNGEYKFDGSDELGNNADGSPVVWTIDATVDGQGTGSDTVTVRSGDALDFSGSASADNPLTGQNITLVPRKTSVTINVEDGAGNPLAATVSLTGQTATVATGGTVTFTDIDENTGPLTYSASLTNYVSSTPATVALTPYSTNITVTPDIVLQPQTTDVTFTVKGSQTGTPAITNATVSMRPAGQAPSGSDPTATHQGAGVYTFTGISVLTASQDWTVSAPSYVDDTGTITSFLTDPNVSADLDPDTVTVTFTVTSDATGNPPVTGATVALFETATPANTITVTESTGGIYTATVSMLSPELTWTADKTGFTGATDTLSSFGSDVGVPVELAVI